MLHLLCDVELIWTPEHVTHMWERHKITPEQADEALRDPYLLVQDPDRNRRPGGTGVRFIGCCESEKLLVVMGFREDARMYGRTAWRCERGQDHDAYWANRTAHGGGEP